MQRYFINKNVTENSIIIDDKNNCHHIKDVMRMSVGDKIIILTNDKKEYLCKIDSITNIVMLSILESNINNNELDCFTTIAHALVRREKKEEVLRRLVELGCSEYVPVEMERSIVKINKLNENIDRIHTIVKECSEQSERGLLMKVCNAIKFNNFINNYKDYDYKFVCYENSGRKDDYSLNNYLNNLKGKKILCVIGPEGGFSDNEINLLIDNGFVCIGLGKRILRTETAPLFIMSLISYQSGVKNV